MLQNILDYIKTSVVEYLNYIQKTTCFVHLFKRLELKQLEGMDYCLYKGLKAFTLISVFKLEMKISLYNLIYFGININ